MGLNKEVLVELIPKILAKDPEAFDLFLKEYGQIVNLHANKWLWAVQKASMNLYDYDDLTNEIWEFIINRLPMYNPEKSSMTTFMYMVCGQAAERIVGYYNRKMRNPGEEWTPTSLDLEFGDDEDLKLIDLIADPIDSIENRVMAETTLHEYLYFLKDFVKGLNHQQQIVYLHMAKGLTLQESADILCVSRQRVDQIRHTIQEKIMRKKISLEKLSYIESDNFAINLMGSKSDDEISDELSVDLGTVKICREILSATDLYRNGR